MENKKNTDAEVKGIQFPIKLCLFQSSRSKTVGERFLAEKVSLFREGESIKMQQY